MENIGASVSAVLTAEKKEVEVKKVVEEEEVEEEYHQMENEMIFCLEEALNIKYPPWRNGLKMHGEILW